MHISYISRGTQYLSLGEAYQVPIMSYAHTKQTSKCPRGESGGRFEKF